MDTTKKTRRTATGNKIRGCWCDDCGKVHSYGNSTDRRRRRANLLHWHGNGTVCPCSWCGKSVDDTTIEQDRIIATCRYVYSNLIPSCGDCNRTRSNLSVEEFLSLCDDPDRAVDAMARAKAFSPSVVKRLKADRA